MASGQTVSVLPAPVWRNVPWIEALPDDVMTAAFCKRSSLQLVSRSPRARIGRRRIERAMTDESHLFQRAQASCKAAGDIIRFPLLRLTGDPSVKCDQSSI